MASRLTPRLAFVSGRRAALGALTRKYGADVTEVLAWEVEARARVENMEGADERFKGSWTSEPDCAADWLSWQLPICLGGARCWRQDWVRP